MPPCRLSSVRRLLRTPRPGASPLKSPPSYRSPLSLPYLWMDTIFSFQFPISKELLTVSSMCVHLGTPRAGVRTTPKRWWTQKVALPPFAHSVFGSCVTGGTPLALRTTPKQCAHTVVALPPFAHNASGPSAARGAPGVRTRMTAITCLETENGHEKAVSIQM